MLEKRNVWLPVLMMVAFTMVFAITRWPGLMPPNFSAAYALVFCAGVFFRNRHGWWAPLLVMAVTDMLLNRYYGVSPQWYQLGGYLAYIAIIALGRCFKPSHSILRLVCGGIMGGLIFYLLTNTAAWFFNPFGNPEYTKTFGGWLIALTKGAGNWPQTWEFLRNTLLSSGLFTGLFVAAMKFSEHLESAAEKKAANVPVGDGEAEAPDAEPEKA